jgi:predicted ABC-type ATPase
VPNPELWIIAGPNGAGKTTLAQAHPIGALLPRVPFLNPDDVAQALLVQRGYRSFADAPEPIQRETFLAAAKSVAAQLDAALHRGEAIGVETVLSTDKYRSAVEWIHKCDGFVGLIYVGLASPELACARVARRVRAGGHDVPVEKVHARWHRSLGNLGWFAARASAFWVFDNSSENPDEPPMLVATGQDGIMDFRAVTADARLLAALSSLPLHKAK